jgi:hypothetical protein
MSGWDSGAVSSANLRLNVGVDNSTDPATITHVDAQNQFRQFLRTFESDDGGSFPYRDELKANWAHKQFFVSTYKIYTVRHRFLVYLLKHMVRFSVLPSSVCSGRGGYARSSKFQ